MPLVLDGNGDITGLAAGALPSNVIGAGGVLQVVQTTKTDTFTTTNNSFTDVTGLSVSITPTSATSKILVLCDVGFSCQNGSGGVIRIVRGSTAIYVGDAAGSRPLGLGQIDGTSSQYAIYRMSGIYLDSPATTSSTTYKIQIFNSTGSNTSAVNRAEQDRNTSTYDTRSASSITVMEIAA